MRAIFAKILGAVLICLTTSTLAYPQTNDYRDSESGVSLSLPPGWKWSGPERWGDQESVLFLKEPGTLQVVHLYVKVLQPPEKMMPAEKMNRRLLKQAKGKVEQRTKEGYANYRLDANALFYTRLPAEQLDDFKARIDPIIETLQIP
ncbi:MAG: hypothetical protein WBV69_04975 [Candidatus Sulfotelmatobacter sp.]